MSLQDLANDAALTPERPSQVSLDPTQPTREELFAREQQARQAPQAVPPQQGPGIAFARLGPTNPAQVALTNPAVPQVGAAPDEAEKVQDATKLALAEEGSPQATDATEAAQPAEEAAPDYNVNPPAIYRPPPHRPATQFGDDWPPTKMSEAYPGVAPGPDNPSPQEAYPNMVDANAQSARWASKPVADAYGQANLLLSPIAAIADAFSKGKFSQNFSAAYLRGMQIQLLQGLEKNREANELHQDELSGVNRIAKMDQAGLISHQQAHDMMRNYLIEHQHDNYLPILDSHGTAGIFKLYQIEDANWRRSHAAATTLRKATNVDGEDAILKTWGIKGGAEYDTEGMGTGRDTAAPQPPAGGELKGELAPFNSLSADQQAAARALFNRTPVPGLAELEKSGPRGKAEVAKVYEMARALEARTSRIAAYQDPKMDPDELSRRKMDALEQTDPEHAKFVQGLKSLSIDPKSDQMKDRRHSITQTQQVFPGWNEDMFHQFHAVWNNERSPVSLQLAAGNRATTQAVVLEAAINRLKIPEDSTIPANVWNEWKTNGYTSDPQFAALNEPLRAFAGEYIYLTTGRVNVTPVTQFLREAPLYGGKAQLRTTLRQAMIGGLHIMEQRRASFNRETGLDGNPPATDPDAVTLYSVFARSNPNTGKFPKDAPSELFSIQPSAADMARRPRWRTPDQEFEPMTTEEYGGLRATVDKMRKENPNDPRLPKLLHELGIQQ